MTFHDILLEQQLEQTRKLDLAWARFQEEAMIMDRAAHRGLVAAVRHGIAAALVRASIWLDRRAGERAFTPMAQ